MKTLSTLLLLSGVAVLAQTPATTPAADQPPPAALEATARPPPLTREQIQSLRAELRAGKSGLLAKNVSFTEDEAARFWPLYRKYEAAVSALNDKRFELLMKYVDAGEKGDPSIAVNLVKASLKGDLDLARLRMDYAPRFAKVLPREKAARVIQVERALTLIADAKLAAMVPLLPWYPWPPLEE